MDISSILKYIQQNHKSNSSLLIAIDGRSGSGKSLIAEEIKKRLSFVKIIHLDDFDMYQGDSSYKKVIDAVLIPIKNNPHSGEVLILEGIFALHSDLAHYYNYRIWVECPAKIGFERGLARDKKLNGIDNSDKWLNYWMPKEEEYIKNQNPQTKADFVIDGSKSL